MMTVTIGNVDCLDKPWWPVALSQSEKFFRAFLTS